MVSEEVLEEFWYGLSESVRGDILKNCFEEYDKFLIGKEFNIGLVNQYFKIEYKRFVEHVEKGRLELVKVYVQLGVDINRNDDLSLHLASRYGHLDIVRYLVDHGADIHAGGGGALRWSSGEGHLDIVRYLVECGADVHVRNDEALQRATNYGYTEVMEYLKSVS